MSVIRTTADAYSSFFLTDLAGDYAGVWFVRGGSYVATFNPLARAYRITRARLRVYRSYSHQIPPSPSPFSVPDPNQVLLGFAFEDRAPSVPVTSLTQIGSYPNHKNKVLSSSDNVVEYDVSVNGPITYVNGVAVASGSPFAWVPITNDFVDFGRIHVVLRTPNLPNPAVRIPYVVELECDYEFLLR